MARPAARYLVVERSRRQSRGPARHQIPRRLPDHVTAPKKRPCARWIRMPDRGSLWLLPSGPDQIRNMSSSEPIERARRSIYITCSRPAEQDVPRSKGKPHECTAAKRRGRKYATAPHQLLHGEHSSAAQAQRHSTSTPLAITALEDNADNANGCTGYDQPNDGQN